MKRLRIICIGLVLALVGIPGIGLAKPKPAQPPPVDPAAVAALDAMGAYLKTLHAFSVQAETAKDEVLESGQKLQFGSTVAYSVKKPDQLRIDVQSDRQNRQMYYDGKTFTLFGSKLKYYAQVPAPPTIRALLDVAEDKYGIDMPLADLFYWGDGKAEQASFAEASVIGPATINGTMCDHYAFRQEGIDWQIWIERGATPVPRKLVITTTTEPAQPQFAAVYTWNLKPDLASSVFQFTPPEGAHRITMVDLSAAKTSNK